MTVPPRRRREPDGVHVHRSTLRPEDMTIVEGIPVTSLARTRATPAPATSPPRWLRDGGTIRPDLLWPAHRLVVEVDGDDWHAHRSARRRDHARDADVQELGLMIVRVLADELDHRPREVVTRLGALLEARGA